MELLVLVVSAFVSGFVAFVEATRYDERDDLPWELSPSACAMIGLFVGFLGAAVFPPLVVGTLVGVAGYEGAEKIKLHHLNRSYGISNRTWAALCGGFGTLGTLLTSAAAWGLVCGIVVLVGALFLANAENKALRAVNEALMMEKKALLAERQAQAAEKAKVLAADKARVSASAADPSRRRVLFAVGASGQAPAGAVAEQSIVRSFVGASAAGHAGAGGSVDTGADLLPRSAKAPVRHRGQSAHGDLLPRRR